MYRQFENIAREYLEKLWQIKLLPQKINIEGFEKEFDFVSSDHKFIGDAKFYKDCKSPGGKFGTIAEYVWLLEKTKAEHKFLVFGNDITVPKRWLKRFGTLTDVRFFYLKDNKLEFLNEKEVTINKEKLYNISTWSEEDINLVMEARNQFNKWKLPEY